MRVQRSSRFVHDKDSSIQRESLGYGNNLLLTKAETANWLS